MKMYNITTWSSRIQYKTHVSQSSDEIARCHVTVAAALISASEKIQLNFSERRCCRLAALLISALRCYNQANVWMPGLWRPL